VSRRPRPVAGLSRSACRPGTSAQVDGRVLDLERATIPQLQQLMATGRLTSRGLTRAYLARARRLDPVLHALTVLNPAATAEAAAADRRRRAGAVLGPLDGIPVLVKDNVDTAGLLTSAGSRALLAPHPAADAVLVTRLRAAGAVMLGKAAMSEWGNFRSAFAAPGWSAVAGQTNNPYVLDRSPCGSSSGAAVAVSACLAQLAVGTETDASLMCPAGINGVVGHKPSRGLVPRTGVVPVSLEQDTPGLLGRHVVDVALALEAIQGPDPSDPASTEAAGVPADHAAGLDRAALRGARLGVWRLTVTDPGVDRVMARVARLLERMGAELVGLRLPYQEKLVVTEYEALLVELRRDVSGYLAARGGPVRSLADVVEFNRSDPVELSRYGQEIFEAALDNPVRAGEPRHREWRETALRLARRSVDETLAELRLDAIVAPTNGPSWPTDMDYSSEDAVLLGSSSPAAVAGYPNVTVPAGFAGPLPVGVSFFAGRWADAAVLRLAYAFEQASRARRPPRYLTTRTPRAGGR